MFIDTPQALKLIERMFESAYNGKVPQTALDAFDSMLGQNFPLTEKQLRWIQNVAVQLELVAEPSSNAWSSMSPAEQARKRGKEVPEPPALAKKALRPPHRMHELEKKKEGK